MSVETGTIEVTRDFDVPAGLVFAAWADEQAQLAWGHPGEGWSMAFDRFGFAVGESHICRFGPDGGQQYRNENRYLLIENDRRIVYATTLSSEGGISFAGTVAIILEPRDGGTRMRLIEHGLYVDGLDDVEGHEAGWSTMLDALSRHLST